MKNFSRSRTAILGVFVMLSATSVQAQELQLNDAEYFESRGFDALVFSNWYNGLFSDSKISGIEIIHHGVRTATNGDVRLHATPEQWDAIPVFVERKVDKATNTVEAFLRYPDFDFDYSIRVKSDAASLAITVHLPKALPDALIGKAGLNLEFLPAAYFEHAFLADDESGIFPLYPTGPKEQNDVVAAQPLATGNSLVLAPENPQRKVSIESADEELLLYDGRTKAQNGWFVVRSELPSGQSGQVLEWKLSAGVMEGWTRDPVIGHSQLGYHPTQQKVAVIELDRFDNAAGVARLYRVDSRSGPDEVLKAETTAWGSYQRYDYRLFDFSAIDEPGIYLIDYDGQQTAAFRIANDVFAKAWHSTLDIFFPVQMDHVLVNEAYRVWHGASHLDDALQAPVDHEHFDLYAQGPVTDTQYEPGEHIPGLNIGGWYDAGDYDIRTQSQYRTVNDLVNLWETFRPTRDNTTVDYARKYVDIHVADNKPDVLQQIEHGTLFLLSQYRAVGHAIPGVIVPHISQYTHLGDGLTMTDNLVFDPAMSELENDGINSGVFDDRWAFTSRSSALNFGSAAALAAASRALQGYNDELAAECLRTAVNVWDEEQSRDADLFRYGNTTGGSLASEEMKAAVELLVTTGEQKYADRFLQYLPELNESFAQHAILAVRALEFMDDDFRAKVATLVAKHSDLLESLNQQNPYGVLITEGGWAGNGTIINIAVTNYYLHQAFPALISAEDVFSGLNYLYGTHPGSDISFVSAVGAQSKKVAYGMNRADYSFIAGGIVPGVLILKPNFPENKEDWPFLWGENEYVITLGANYIFLVNAVDELLNQKN